MRNKTRIIIILLSTALLVSIFFNIKPAKKLNYISFSDANLRETYNSFHKIKEAQNYATGKGVKVGIIDKYFGFTKNTQIYAGGKNFTGNKNDFEEISEHGFWMATTLKEIAPDVEVFALNARTSDMGKEKDAIINAINWAIDNEIDILTYSADPFEAKYRNEIDSAVRDAIEHNITIVFIHYDLPENILPFVFLPDSLCPYSRLADLNIYHCDYNLLLLDKYEKYVECGGKQPENFGDQPFLSFSSMAPVVAGVVAMVKEVNGNLSPQEIKQLIIESSRELNYKGYLVNHVLNAELAVKNAIQRAGLQSAN